MEAPEGSGSFVAWDDSRNPPRWLVVTAGHVQEGGYTPFVIWRGKKLPAAVLMPNSGYDLMALECMGASPSKVIPLATEYARQGDSVRYEGFVAQTGRDNIVTGYGGVTGSGRIVEYRQTLMDVEGLTQGGMSGGPIYDRRGLQGVLATNSPGFKTSRGRSTLKLWDLLKKAGIHVEGTRYRLAQSVTIDVPIPDAPLPPTVDPAVPPVDIDIPIPGEDTEPPEEDGELTLMLTEITNNQTNIITNQTNLTENQTALIAKLDDLTSRVEQLEKVKPPDLDVLIDRVLMSLGHVGGCDQSGCAEHCPIANLVAMFPPIYFRHIDGETGEVFKPEEPIHLGGGYEFVRFPIDWAEAAKKIAPHLPSATGTE
jgi:hypothetical protein